MQRKFKISVDGRAYDVVVEEIVAEGAHEATPTPHAVFATAHASVQAPPTAAAGPGAEVAPLAGVIVALDVAVGQEVAAGERIAILEAMKMKTEVFAKGAGRVASIAVKVGESVDTGGVLLTLV